ncbi:Protein GDAP2-like protein [Bienertia sinuspersici]
MCSSSVVLSESEQFQLIQKLNVFRIHGRDKRGRKILTILAKFFPARIVTIEVVKKYLEEKIYPKLQKKGVFSVLYIHTDVERGENFPGISALRSIWDDIPPSIQSNLESVYFLHPGLQSRLFLATFGRLFFLSGLYSKVKYVSRVDFLWENIRRNAIELPDYVYDHDEDLEHRPMMDYGLESDHPRVYDAPSVDSPLATYSMRCIS